MQVSASVAFALHCAALSHLSCRAAVMCSHRRNLRGPAPAAVCTDAVCCKQYQRLYKHPSACLSCVTQGEYALGIPTGPVLLCLLAPCAAREHWCRTHCLRPLSERTQAAGARLHVIPYTLNTHLLNARHVAIRHTNCC